MMHGPEKSDSVIVAVKPTNKAEQSAAELVEPRTGTKGNAGQQSTLPIPRLPGPTRVAFDHPDASTSCGLSLKSPKRPDAHPGPVATRALAS